tara:strand:- start:70 stop:258 length:189 start_codon:yes stop_codon:yes gene_type:complete
MKDIDICTLKKRFRFLKANLANKLSSEDLVDNRSAEDVWIQFGRIQSCQYQKSVKEARARST